MSSVGYCVITINECSLSAKQFVAASLKDGVRCQHAIVASGFCTSHLQECRPTQGCRISPKSPTPRRSVLRDAALHPSLPPPTPSNEQLSVRAGPRHFALLSRRYKSVRIWSQKVMTCKICPRNLHRNRQLNDSLPLSREDKQTAHSTPHTSHSTHRPL